MSQLNLLAAEAALAKMIDDGYFSISTIDKIVKLMGLVPDADAYAFLSTLHCVHYNKMRPELLQVLPDMIAKVLHSPTFDASRLNIVPAGHGLRVISG